MMNEYEETDDDYHSIADLYVNTGHKNKEYIKTCGSKKCAIITLIVGFFFPLVWCMGLSTCCKSENETDCKVTYHIYIIQRFLLMASVIVLFMLLYYYNVVSNMFLITNNYTSD